jgi:hypothetical protein
MKHLFNASALVIALALILNQWQLGALQHHIQKAQAAPLAATAQLSADAAQTAPSGAIQQAMQQLIARGIPPVYGAELEVSFDDAAAAIPILSPHEQDARPDKLTGKALERYIDIGSRISCEFCCSARTLVFSDGRKACACAHSEAMRGVMAHLLTAHSDMSDQQIYNEVAKWKSAFFPGPTVQKAVAGQGGGPATQGLPPQVGGC